DSWAARSLPTRRSSELYRHSGGTVLLPPGELTMIYGRGPEYQLLRQKITVPESGTPVVKVQLKRWIDPMVYGFYSGDHHIHAAGDRKSTRLNSSHVATP